MSKNNLSKTNSKNSVKHAKKISKLMLNKKALDIIIVDVRKLTTLTDFFVVCTSESAPQTKAISDYINGKMKEAKIKSWHTEGYENLDWVLIDFVNVVVHIFNKEFRQYYEFERLWADGQITKIEDKH